MIVDKIANWSLYFPKDLGKRIFNELKNYNLETPDGIYKSHNDFYFKVMTYETKLLPSVIESHKKEVDIQILLSGHESIEIFDSSSVDIKKHYEESLDCQFYYPKLKPHSRVNLKPGLMAIFFPDDIHQPQFATESKKEVLKKIVIKVNEKFFTFR